MTPEPLDAVIAKMRGMAAKSRSSRDDPKAITADGFYSGAEALELFAELLADLRTPEEPLEGLITKLEAIRSGVGEAVNCRKAKALGCDCRIGGEIALKQLDNLLAALRTSSAPEEPSA